MKAAGLVTKTPSYISKKVQALLAAKNHNHTESEVNAILSKQKGTLKSAFTGCEPAGVRAL